MKLSIIELACLHLTGKEIPMEVVEIILEKSKKCGWPKRIKGSQNKNNCLDNDFYIEKGSNRYKGPKTRHRIKRAMRFKNLHR